MRHPAIINELTRRIGLNPDSLGDHAINSVIDGRMRYFGTTDENAYLSRMNSDSGEFQKLINEIVVSETWFFRGAEFFETVAKHVRQLSASRPVGTPVRILSVACSTGEEPYSLAMALEQSGLPEHCVKIDAVDISTRNLEIARLGRYGEFSFRQADRAIRDLFFYPSGTSHWELKSAIKARVNFRLGNLMDSNFLGEEAAYDLICCRNVFIYFTPEARRTALRHFNRLLRADGMIGLGHAESSELSEPRWTRFGPEAACLFQRCSETASGSQQNTLPSFTSTGSQVSSISNSAKMPTESKTISEFKQSSTTLKRRISIPLSNPQSRSNAGGDCWNVIGVRGDHSCQELTRYDHCHNCHVYSNAGRRFLDNAPPSGYLAEWTERLSEPIQEQGKDLANVLIFRIRDEWLALPVACVTEVTQPRSFHRVPHRGGLLDGIINVRGELHLLVRVDELLGLTPSGQESLLTRKSRMLLAGPPSNLWAFMVSEVDRVRSVPIGEMLAVPATVARSSARFTRGVIVGDGRTTGLLDDAQTLRRPASATHMNDESDDYTLFDFFLGELRSSLGATRLAIERLEDPAQGKASVSEIVEIARSIRGASRIVGIDAAARLAAALEQSASSLISQPPAGSGGPVVTGWLLAVDLLAGLAKTKEADVAEWAASVGADIDDVITGLKTPSDPETDPPIVVAKKAAPSAEPKDPPALKVTAPATGSTVPPDLLELFRDELRTHATSLSAGILELENDVSNPQRIEPLMRAAHSIKGASRIVSIDLAVELAHILEDVFVAAQKGKLTIRPADIDVFLAAADAFATLAQLSESEIANWSQSRATEVKPIESALAAILKGEAPVQLTKLVVPVPSPIVEAEAATPEPVAKTETAPHPERTTDEPVVRVTAARLNRLMGLAGESLVQARWLQPFASSLLQLKKQQHHLRETLDLLAERTKVGDRSDVLFRLVEEARKQLGECHQTISGRIGEFDDRAASADDLNSRLYREVIASRMRPFADGTQSFPRLVRDMSRTLGKKIRLEILGQSTDVDRDILEKLESPLNHMIRNSVDHGMEKPEERLAAGKPETGVIRLEARHRAGTLAITVSDDGRGIDPEKVRKKIVDKGMITADMAAALSQPELLEFLFLPGFSTATAISEYSGRGVGLDVVQEMIRTVGGTVRITSKFGNGATFHLQLPITLSVVRAVLVVIGGESYAFPHNRIDRLLRLPVGEIRTLENRQFITIDGKNIGLVLAAQILNLGSPGRASETLSVILLSDSTGQYGLIVDSFSGEQDLVVRPLDARLGKVPNIAAAAILDDGLPVLIADVEDMIRSMDSFIQTGNVLKLSHREKSVSGPTRGNVLVVDDSATVREVEKQLLRQMGLHVTLANDGQDGWNKLRTGEFDLVVTDIDMPRMTGLEFLALIRADAQHRHMPVIVVSYKDREEERQRGLELGANYYLMKSSFHDNTFVRAVQSLIGGS